MCSQNVRSPFFADPQRRHLVQLKFATKGSSINSGDPAVVASVITWVNVTSSVYTLEEFIAGSCTLQRSR